MVFEIITSFLQRVQCTEEYNNGGIHVKRRTAKLIRNLTGKIVDFLVNLISIHYF
jgi:hypothetical protein